MSKLTHWAQVANAINTYHAQVDRMFAETLKGTMPQAGLREIRAAWDALETAPDRQRQTTAIRIALGE